MLVRNVVTVTDFVVNNVPESVFIFDFPTGTQVIDFSRVQGRGGKYVGLSYQTGVNAETTQREIDNATKHLRSLLPTPVWIKAVLCVGSGLGLVALLYFCFRSFVRRMARSRNV